MLSSGHREEEREDCVMLMPRGEAQGMPGAIKLSLAQQSGKKEE